MKPYIVAIIPARHDATRLPGKPLIQLCGKPMVQHVYERAKQASLISRVIVATDNDMIVNVQGDEPLLVPEMIDSAARLVMQDASIRVGTLIRRIETADELVNPNVVKAVIDMDQYAIYFSRSPIPHGGNGMDMKTWVA